MCTLATGTDKSWESVLEDLDNEASIELFLLGILRETMASETTTASYYTCIVDCIIVYEIYSNRNLPYSALSNKTACGYQESRLTKNEIRKRQ